MNTRLNLISIRQQAAALGVAAAVTLVVLGALGQVADGYNAELQAARAMEAGAATAMQTVVAVAQRSA
jgi:hypothetical protein